MGSDDTQWIVGPAFGILAYALGYLGTMILLALDSWDGWGRLVDVPGLGEFHLVGWVFYSANLVGISGEEGAVFAENVNLLSEANPSIPVVLYFAVPAITLLLCGFAVSYYATRGRDATTGGIMGASMAIGYGLLSILGTVLFAVSRPIGTAQPDIGYSILLMVGAYPILIGGIAGVVGATIKD